MLSRVLSALLVAAALATAPAFALTPSGPITISGQIGTVVSGLHITSTRGPCVQILNSTDITLENNEIGPCGTNNSTAASNGVEIASSTGVRVYDSYIHVENLASGCCDTHDNIFIQGSSYVTVRGNVIAYGEANVQAGGAGNSYIAVLGNFLLNPRGPFPRGDNVQVYAGSASSPNSNITVNDNYTLSSTDTTKYLFPENQEDSINFGFTNGIVAMGNYIVGGHSTSGCGLIADDGSASALFAYNDLSNTGGACGIGIATGTNMAVVGNKVLNLTADAPSGGVAIYATANYPPQSCGPVLVANNIADAEGTSGVDNPFYNPGSCSPVTVTDNTFGRAAEAILKPMATTNPPPPIPPQPVMCVVASPYTTNTSLPTCSGGGATE